MHAPAGTGAGLIVPYVSFRPGALNAGVLFVCANLILLCSLGCIGRKKSPNDTARLKAVQFLDRNTLIGSVSGPDGTFSIWTYGIADGDFDPAFEHRTGILVPKIHASTRYILWGECPSINHLKDIQYYILKRLTGEVWHVNGLGLSEKAWGIPRGIIDSTRMDDAEYLLVQKYGEGNELVFWELSRPISNFNRNLDGISADELNIGAIQLISSQLGNEDGLFLVGESQKSGPYTIRLFQTSPPAELASVKLLDWALRLVPQSDGEVIVVTQGRVDYPFLKLKITRSESGKHKLEISEKEGWAHLSGSASIGNQDWRNNLKFISTKNSRNQRRIIVLKDDQLGNEVTVQEIEIAPYVPPPNYVWDFSLNDDGSTLVSSSDFNSFNIYSFDGDTYKHAREIRIEMDENQRLTASRVRVTEELP